MQCQNNTDFSLGTQFLTKANAPIEDDGRGPAEIPPRDLSLCNDKNCLF